MKKTIILATIIFFSTASFAQMDHSKMNHEKQDTTVTYTSKYSCPMHPDVIKETPGKCPKCGMNLVKVEKTKKLFPCQMHPSVIKDAPSKCPKCGMNLVEKKPDSEQKMKME